MDSKVLHRCITSLEDLVILGKKLLETENYASELKDYYDFSNSVKEYILKYSQD